MREKQNWIVKLLSGLPDWLLYISVAILILDEFLRSTFSISFLKSDTKDLRISVGIAAITLFIVTIRLELNKFDKKLSNLSNKYLGVLEILPSHESIDFPSMLQTCSEIRILSLSGTKTISLGDSKVQEMLSDPARKAKITLLLANPYSSAIINRYENDEPESYEAGLGGIERRLLWLHKLIESLPSTAKRKIDVRVYDNYPVVSIVQADNDIYSSSYGFKLRGGDCPKVHSEKGGGYGIFLLKHFGKVYERAMTLDKWFSAYESMIDKANSQ